MRLRNRLRGPRRRRTASCVAKRITSVSCCRGPCSTLSSRRCSFAHKKRVPGGRAGTEEVEVLPRKHLRGREVDTQVPAARDLFVPERTLRLLYQVIAVELDRLEQLAIADRAREADVRIRNDLREAALRHEEPLLLRVHELDEPRVGAEVPTRNELRHLGVDRRHATCACDRDTMVPVDDEVGVAELVDDDGRKVAVRERRCDLPPALAHIGPEGAEVAVEVADAAVRPDDLRHVDRANSEEATRERAQPLRRLIQNQQFVRHTRSTRTRPTAFRRAGTGQRRGRSRGPFGSGGGRDGRRLLDRDLEASDDARVATFRE